MTIGIFFIIIKLHDISLSISSLINILKILFAPYHHHTSIEAQLTEELSVEERLDKLHEAIAIIQEQISS